MHVFYDAKAYLYLNQNYFFSPWPCISQDDIMADYAYISVTEIDGKMLIRG